MAPRDPLSSMRRAFLRPVAYRVASNAPIAPDARPPSSRAVNQAASSTVTCPRSSEAVPESPTRLAEQRTLGDECRQRPADAARAGSR